MWISKPASSPYYRAYWTGADGKQKSITTKQTSEQAARAWARENHVEEMESAAKMGALTPQLVTRLLTGRNYNTCQAVARWLAWARDTGAYSASTIEQCRVTLDAWIRDTNLSTRPVASITSQEVTAYINRPTSRKETSINNELGIIRRLYQYLQGEGIVTANPATNARVCVDGLLHVQRETERRQPFTEAEVERLLQETNGFWKVAVAIAACTGLRLGDIASLEWESLSADYTAVVWTNKTDARVSVALDSRAVGLLRELPGPRAGLVFPVERDIALDPKRRALLSVQFSRILKRAGITGKSFHSLRHAYVSKLAKEGVPVRDIADTVGHSNVATTAIYMHG